jgi:hypothetical protein
MESEVSGFFSVVSDRCCAAARGLLDIGPSGDGIFQIINWTTTGEAKPRGEHCHSEERDPSTDAHGYPLPIRPLLRANVLRRCWGGIGRSAFGAESYVAHVEG